MGQPTNKAVHDQYSVCVLVYHQDNYYYYYLFQRDSPLVRLLGGEGTIPKSTQYVTLVTDTTQ